MTKVINRMKGRIARLNERIAELEQEPNDFNYGLMAAKKNEAETLESLIHQIEVERRVYYGLSESEFRQIFKSDRAAI